MLYVGLTGGIASGKSLVARRLVELGARLIDTDQISREVVQPGRPAWARIKERFGEQVLRPDGRLNRALLRRIIFEDPQERLALNEIVHPEVLAEVERVRARHQAEDPGAVVVVDLPLLVEAGLADHFDRVILVYVPPEVQESRLMARDGLSRDQARTALAAQRPLDEKVPFADFVIDNQGPEAETLAQVDRLYRHLVSLAQ